MHKAKILITLKDTILDPQGKTVEHSLHSLGYSNISNTRIGKYITLDIDSATTEEACKITDAICNKILSNPVMEDYSFELTKIE